MNKASRNKDLTKIKYFGAFASALGFIVYCGNQNDSKLGEEFEDNIQPHDICDISGTGGVCGV